MPSVDRSYWLAVGAVSYVAIAALQHGQVQASGLALFVAGPWILYFVWRLTRPDVLAFSQELAALRASRLACAAALASGNAILAPTGSPFLELIAPLATGTCAVAAAYGLARIAPGGGAITPGRLARSLDAASFIGFLWSVAWVVSAVRFVTPERAARLDPLTLNYSTTAASIGSLLVLITAAWRVRVLRALELGVADRAEAAVVLTVSALSVAVPVAAIDVAAPDRVLPLALLAASLGCLWVVLARDAASVSSVLRGSVAVMILGVPTALLVGVLARRHPQHAGPIGLAGAALSLLAGLIARNVARPLGPEQSRWLRALHEASQNALLPEPNQAIVATLSALKKVSKDPSVTAELWLLSPPSVLSVDVAGYLHEKPAQIPEGLCEMALAEPENTLRAETLQALQVQKPRTRALWAWFEARGLFCATLVLDEDGPLGFLTLPRAERSQTLTLEEARAARRLTDRLSALVALTSTLSRARRRETELVVRAEQAESRFQEARRVIDGQTSRERELARTLAKPLLSAAYSPAARLALAAVEQQARQGGPILLLAAVGVDATAWAAAAHTTGNGRPGAFLAVDAALEARGPERRFADPENSPWQLCRGGTLFIKDVHLLPESAQQDLLSALSSADPNGAWPSALLIASLATSASESPPLALPKLLMPLFKLPALELPTLKNRPEDLRALILDAIARQPGGEQARGVERRAMQALMDHGWPGNERELNDVVERATLHARGPLVTLEDLRAVGFAVDTTDSQFALAPLARPESPISPRPSSPPPRRRSRAPRPRARG